MELQGEDGSVIELSETLQKELGRGPAVSTHDRTVSRRQVRLQLSENRSRLRVSVEVIGPNPICLVHSNGQVRIAKPGTHSSLEAGDKLSLSIQDPVFYTLQDLVAKLPGNDQGVDPDDEEGIAEAVARWQRRKQERLQLEQTRATQEGAETLNPKPGQVEGKRQVENTVSGPELVSSQREADDVELIGGSRTDEDDTDFVKRFGFVVEGSEFERYGKKAHDTSKWEWQIGPRPADDSDEEEAEERTHGKRIRNTSGSKANQNKARRATDEDDDDDWQGDSEGEQKLLSTGKRRKKEAQTRSRDLPTSSSKPKPVSTSAIKSKEQSKTRVNSSSIKRKKDDDDEDEEEDDEEDDGEDLDGFLVDDVEEEDEPEAADDEDELSDEDEDEDEDEKVEEEEIDENSDDKPLCKYGSNCFRKNKDHLAQFRH